MANYYVSPHALSAATPPAPPAPRPPYTVQEGDTTVTSNSPHAPLASLRTLPAAAPLAFAAPTPIQRYAIPMLAHGHSVRVRAPTGMGKTLCFVLPILQALRPGGGPQACIIAPTRELCEQTKRVAEQLAEPRRLRVTAIYGSCQRASSYRHIDVLVAAPGRLLDCLSSGAVKFGALRFFVLDEADKLLEMGFERDIRAIHAHVPAAAQRALFSATFHASLARVIAEILPATHLFAEIARETLPNITQRVVPAANRDAELLRILRGYNSAPMWGDPADRILIFVERRTTADRLEATLLREKIHCQALHGDKPQPRRHEILARFQKGSAPFLIATSVAARGIDVKDIRLVINYELPSDIHEYIHRIGRTGREGKPGEALSFYDARTASEDFRQALVKALRESNNEVPAFLLESVRGRPRGERGERSERGERNDRPRRERERTGLAERSAVAPTTAVAAAAVRDFSTAEKEDSDDDVVGGW